MGTTGLCLVNPNRCAINKIVVFESSPLNLAKAASGYNNERSKNCLTLVQNEEQNTTPVAGAANAALKAGIV